MARPLPPSPPLGSGSSGAALLHDAVVGGSSDGDHSDASAAEVGDPAASEKLLTFESDEDLVTFSSNSPSAAVLLSSKAYKVKCADTGICHKSLFLKLVARNIFAADTMVETSRLVALLLGTQFKLRISGGGERLQASIKSEMYEEILGSFSNIDPVFTSEERCIALSLLYVDLNHLSKRAAGFPGDINAQNVLRGAELIAASAGGQEKAVCLAHADWATEKVKKQLLGYPEAAGDGAEEGGGVEINSMGKIFLTAVMDTSTDAVRFGQGHYFSLSAAAADGSGGLQMADEALVCVTTSGPRAIFVTAAGLGAQPMGVPELGVGADGSALYAVALVHSVKPPESFVMSMLEGGAAPGRHHDARFAFQAFASSSKALLLRDPEAALAALTRSGVAVKLVSSGLNSAATMFHGASLERLLAQTGALQRGAPPNRQVDARLVPLTPLFLGVVASVRSVIRPGMGHQFSSGYPRNPAAIVNGRALISHGDANEEMRFGSVVVAAWTGGGLGAAGVPPGTLRTLVARALHVEKTRLASLAAGHVGYGVPSSKAFRDIYELAPRRQLYTESPPSEARSALHANLRAGYQRYSGLVSLQLPVDHALLFVQPLPAPLLAAAEPAAAPPLIAGGNSLEEMRFGSVVVAAWTGGGLGAAGVPPGTLSTLVARALHVSKTRLASLAAGKTGKGDSSSKAFRDIYELAPSHQLYTEFPPSEARSALHANLRAGYQRYSGLVSLQLPVDHALLFVQPVPAPLLAAAEPAAAPPLIVGGNANDEMLFGLALLTAWKLGALAGNVLVPGASMTWVLARVLHVDQARISCLATGHAGGRAHSGEAFRKAYSAVGGAAHYESKPPSNERDAAAAAVVQALSAYIATVGHRLPVHHAELLTSPAAALLPAAAQAPMA